MRTTDFIVVATARSIEEGSLPGDSLLKKLNPLNDPAAAWLATGRRRLDELDSGGVAAVPGDEVFERACRHLGINETPTRPQAEGRSYAEILAERVATAERWEFASATEVARFFAENSG